MIVPRVILFVLLSVSVAASAQPIQPAPTQQPTSVTKPQENPDDKVSCRIDRQGNSLKRTCLTKSQWKKVDSQSQDVDETGLRNSRCPLGAC